MHLKFANRICPNCKNPNYMVFLGNLSKEYKYKCMNCNGYFNDIDFEKEPLQPVLKSECTNSKVDMVEVVRCKNCRNAYILPWLDNAIICEKHSYTGVRPEEFYCADGKRRDDDAQSRTAP